MEYHGELISGNDGKRRLTQYPNSVGSYIMFFRFAEKEMCVDATFSKRIGKYVNDGIKSCQNARVRRIIVDTIPRVAIYAVQDISPGTEILYDYGVNDLPWRQSTSKTTQRCSVVLEKMCLADLKEDEFLPTQLAADQSVTEDDVLSTQLAADQSDTEDDVLSTQHTRVSPLKDSSATTLKMSSMEDVKKRSLSQVDCEEVLSEIWRSKSRDANTISKVGPYSISIDALNTIQHWLSDEVMNAYLYMLSENFPQVCHINSVLMTAVFNDQPQIHSLLHQYDFKEFDTIIGAVHENDNHWTLMVILLQQQIILYFNPMGELFLSEQKLLQNWFFFLKERSKLGLVDIATTQWNIGSLLHSKQEDDISCGLYVLKMAENVLSGTTLEFDMSQKDLNDFRMYVGKCLLTGKVSSFQEDITSIDSSMEQFGEMSTDTGSSEDVHIQTVISVDKSICDDDEQSTLEDTTSALGTSIVLYIRPRQ
ncbi:uncharacterized protein LOC143084237 [Mytilus galloprovincialis]|uniref:uncharacterized protein LOC143084237 n=1 Tax=Mytilus galloprovincialis TaxID=29158 RepID=UPI003F7B6823